MSHNFIMMKKNIVIRLIIAWAFFQLYIPGFAQETEDVEGYQFTVIKNLPATSVKNQFLSSTCWSFSTISMLESELIRMGKGEYDLSEMFVIRNTYEDKAYKYVRMHGSINFSGGGYFHDVLNVYSEKGIVPDEVYPGLVIGEENHIHNEMDNVLKGYVDDIIQNKNQKLTPVWHDGFVCLVDTYLGKVPEQFGYKGKTFNAKTFSNELDIDPENYVEITSFTHHPFYEKFILEVPDNWQWGSIYNVPLDELLQIMRNAIEKGYTIAWSSDVSEKGYSWSNGIAVVPDVELEYVTGPEREKWQNLTEKERAQMMFSFSEPVPEKIISQEYRQEGFDNYSTTDDHGMHITGLARDQNGNSYFLVKNSWGLTGSPYEGYFYASEAYVRYKTIAIMVNKNGIPDHIRKKLKID